MSFDMEFDVDGYIKWLEIEAARGSLRFNQFSVDYMRSHAKRYQRTADLLQGISGVSALEVGATDFFQIFLGVNLGIRGVWGTIFSKNVEEKRYRKVFEANGRSVESHIVSIDVEREFFPLGNDYFDLVLLCEVVEHLDVDPMGCMIELNRVMKLGGKLILTTPNSCSARIAFKVCSGYRPHFYMQYERDLSPFKHNFEYDVHALVSLLNGAGFHIDCLQTHDVFEEPMPEALAFLKRNGFPMEHRGDDIFIVARKVGNPSVRWPSDIYV